LYNKPVYQEHIEEIDELKAQLKLNTTATTHYALMDKKLREAEVFIEDKSTENSQALQHIETLNKSLQVATSSQLLLLQPHYNRIAATAIATTTTTTTTADAALPRQLSINRCSSVLSHLDAQKRKQ
jgi:hypothetical protein